MIQEKPTSLRLLQSPKKKSFSAVIYLLIGFFSGILFSLLMFLLFLQPQVTDQIDYNSNQHQTEPQSPTLNKSISQESNSVLPTQHDITASTHDENDFAQPQSNELTKFFQHTPTPAAQPETRISPFANEAQHKTTQTSIPPTKVIQPKNEAVPAQNLIQPTTMPQPAKPATAKVTEAEIEVPQATVQIKVTQKPFSVNELQ